MKVLLVKRKGVKNILLFLLTMNKTIIVLNFLFDDAFQLIDSPTIEGSVRLFDPLVRLKQKFL